MNTEQQNRMSASLYRQLFLLKMLSYEYEYFVKYPLPSGIKNILFRATKVFSSIVFDLKMALPKSQGQIDNQVVHSDEKIRAISTVLEKLASLDEKDALMIEATFDSMITVKY
jgi:hypothetical protein